MNHILLTLIVLHGFFHAFGFLKAFQLVQFRQLTHTISRSQGILWLLSGSLFLCAAILLALQQPFWWLFLGIAVVVSQSLILTDWRDAKFGTIANALILAVTIIGLIGKTLNIIV